MRVDGFLGLGKNLTHALRQIVEMFLGLNLAILDLIMKEAHVSRIVLQLEQISLDQLVHLLGKVRNHWSIEPEKVCNVLHGWVSTAAKFRPE